MATERGCRDSSAFPPCRLDFPPAEWQVVSVGSNALGTSKGHRPMAGTRAVAAGTWILFAFLACCVEPGGARQPDSSPSAGAPKKLSIGQPTNGEGPPASKRSGS